MWPVKPNPAEAENNGGRVVLLMILGLVVLFGGAYVGAYYFAGDKVPRGSTVAGVNIGGRTPEKAVTLLQRGLEPDQGTPIRVTVGSTTRQVRPAQAGLGVDYKASVDAVGAGRSWSPARLWDYYTGGDDLDPVVTVDDAKMTAALARLAAGSGTAPVDGGVQFVDGRVKVTAATDGQGIDPAAAREALTAAYLSDTPEVDLDLVPMDPDIDQDDVQAALNSFANAAVSGPVTLLFDKSPVKLQPADYSSVLSMQAENGVLVPRLDADGLARIVDRHISKHDAAVDATVKLVDGKPKVVPAKPGVRFDAQDISDAFLDVVVQEPGERELKVKATVADAAFTTADARALGIKRRVSTFTTYFPYAEYRNTNIGRAAELVNGTILKPGETFSLNGAVGERTRENGFTEGFIISDGIFKEDLGGGVSQMATTTFNAMFFAGLKDVEHKTHSFYIDRYPVGREATVAWGAVDLRFQNDTQYGVLISAHVTPSTVSTQGVVTVSMYSTKVWDITTSASARYNYTSPATRTLTTADCYPNTGYDGFDIDVTRFFRKAGESALDHKEVMHTRYTPSDTVICKEPPSSPSSQ
jgi:vancomycin resistance protein YoaR